MGFSATISAMNRMKRYAIITFASILAIVFFSGVGAYYYIQRKLPSVDNLKDYSPSLITRVYSNDGQLIGEFFKERRITVALSSMPDYLVKAFIAAEDAKFYEHEGLDYTGILRALYKNITAGKIVQGGSTITQQLVKSFFLTPDRHISRKIKEAVISYRIENYLTKDEILYLYLNQIYLGHGAYGVQAAAETYFGKDVDRINLAEAAMIAGLPKAPNRYSPYYSRELARQRQEHVLLRMLEEGFITRTEMEEALNYQLKIKKKDIKSLWIAPYFTEHVRRYIAGKYGEKLLYNGGLNIYTTLDVEIQKSANEAVRKGLKDYDRRRGFRGPVKTITTLEERGEFIDELKDKLARRPIKLGKVYEGLITSVEPRKRYASVNIGDRDGRIYFKDMYWARLYNPTNDPDGGKYIDIDKVLKEGDVVLVKIARLPTAEEEPIRLSLEQEPLVQASLVSLDPLTGHVKAMVGGSDFSKSEYNRSIQAKRQPGSAFKPIIYAAAMDNGFTPASVIVDSPLVFEDAIEEELDWKPRNYENRFYGPTTLREALTHSRNVVTVKLLKDLGVDTAIEYAHNLGIISPLNKDLSIALGSSSVSLLELTTAYATFAALGKRPEPIFITRVTDKDGNILEENLPNSTEAISPQTAYLMTNLLEGVIQSGTGRRAKVLNKPAAGKTGTTNNLNDAWFIGYTPDLVAGTWLGYDNAAPLGKHETGARAALPIWLTFMQKVTEGTPAKNFEIPEGVVFAKVDPKTGLLAEPYTKNGIFEAFKEGAVPVKGESEGKDAPQSGRFFEMDVEETDGQSM